jgi:hypothetical protein
MLLVRISGLIQKKMLVSANMSIEQLKEKIVRDSRQGQSMILFVGKGGKRVCSPQGTLRDLH